MIETPAPSPDYQWAINTEPDLLVLQFRPLVTEMDGRPRDAMSALFERRGFVALSHDVELDLHAANGCALTSTDDSNAELVIVLGDDGTASRIPVPHRDPAWATRVFDTTQVPVLVTIAAIDETGSLTRERLQRDIAAGGVLAALVPAGALD